MKSEPEMSVAWVCVNIVDHEYRDQELFQKLANFDFGHCLSKKRFPCFHLTVRLRDFYKISSPYTACNNKKRTIRTTTQKVL